MAGSRPAHWRFVSMTPGALATWLMISATAAAQPYPAGPVKVIVPFGAGGATDILARVFSERLQRNLGQPFTVENRGGAAGQIAATAVARSPADGSTLMFTTAAPITIAPLMNDKVQYDPRKDIVPIAVVAVMPVWLVVNADSPLQAAADVFRNAKENPGKLNYGTSGVGTELHLAAEALSRSASVQMVHVPFRGGGEVIAALLGHQLDFAALSTASIAGPLKQGTLRALAVSSPQRMADFPDVPTFSEIGHPGATMMPWWGWMAPAGTPQALIARLTQELQSISKDQAARERLKATFVQMDFAGPEEFAKRIEAETALYGGIIRSANIKLSP
jgi:tripartite-type tricarboxylate transporter receptor subunit TctC